MIQSIGNDIIEIDRIRANFEKYDQKFLDRIYNLEEQNYCLGFQDPAPHLAGRFAAKEAIAKALRTGIGSKLSWLDISILNDEGGAPSVKLSKRALSQFKSPKLLISISHCREYASAVAIVI